MIKKNIFIFLPSNIFLTTLKMNKQQRVYTKKRTTKKQKINTEMTKNFTINKFRLQLSFNKSLRIISACLKCITYKHAKTTQLCMLDGTIWVNFRVLQRKSFYYLERG